MALFLVTFCFMALAVAGMAVGVMFGRRPIAGSCGGLGSSACQTCSRPCRKKRKADARISDTTSASQIPAGGTNPSHVITRQDR